MQVQAVRPGHATVRRGSLTREVRSTLVEPVAPGDWLLVFLDDARERLSAARAAEVDAALALVEAALAGAAPAGSVGFDLPSSWSTEQLEAFK
jgi:hydrogenase expression/formation protein HypC